MIIVSDTSALNYLVLIGEIECLPQLFGSVFIPPAVQRELLHPLTPVPVQEWMLSTATWLTVRHTALPPLTNALGAGESEAIPLAEELSALLLVDDFKARAVARQRGVLVLGTLGVLERAAAARLLSLPEALAKLRTTSFHLTERLAQGALERDRIRRLQR